MNAQIRGAIVRTLFAAVALLLLVTQAQAQNWEAGKVVFEAKCDGCHTPAAKAGRSAAQITSAIGGGVPAMAGITFTGNQLADLVGYLGNINFPTFSRTPGTINFTAVSAGLTGIANVTVTNNGNGDDLTVSAGVSDPVNYAVNLNGCGLIPQNTSCDLIVTFRPQTPGSFDANTLTINHNAIGSPSTVTLNGTGLNPFTVAPASPLTFTPATAPLGTRTVTITDNKGDRIRACRGNAAAFNAPADFTLDSPSPFDPSGCFTAGLGAVPRSISLVVRFTAGAAGPRDATLTIQRVDAGGTPLAGTATVVVQLQGNPGPFATVNASSLFDAVSDPGVEVDNDNTLTRSVTLFSQGSNLIPFSGSSFAISGPSAGEYTLAGTGCQAIAQLPAFTVGTPPSCVLTVVFNPSDVGRRGPATLTIQAAGTNTNTVSLNGLGFRGPRLNVSRNGIPATTGDVVQFGTQTIGGLYPSIGVTLNNGGTLGDLEVVLPAAGSVAGFTFTAGAGCANLAPAASCAVDLRFDPAAVQAYASPFTIRTRPAGSAATYNDFVLDLRGTGSASAFPVLSWTDTTGTPITRLDFADTDAGAPRTSRVRLFNNGPGGVNLQLVNVVGLDAGNFILDTTDCSNGRNVFETTSCELVVQFAPGTAGLKTASIQLTANAGTPPSLVVAPLLTASGTAISSAPPPTLQLSSTTLQFGGTVVGAAALPLELRLLNTGSSNLNVLALTVAAPFVVQSKTCAGVPFVLPAGNECTLSVSFHPQAEGNLAGTLAITTDASAAPLEVALSGRGEAKADLSSGGCSIASGESATDPTLWTLVLLAALALLYRRQARRRAARDRQRRS